MTGLTLRPYQTRAIEDCRAAYASGIRRLLLCLPTGAGKTVVFSEAARSHLASTPGGRVLVLTHRQELVDQATAKLRALGLQVDTAMRGVVSSSGAPVLVGLVDTLRSRTLPARPTLTILDEAHHGVADSWLAQLPPEGYILGVTATPSRLDGRALGHAFDALVVGATVAELQELGHLVHAEVLTSRERADAEHAIRDHAGDRKRIVVYCATLKEARLLAERVGDMGGAECVSGSMPAAKRVAALRRFHTGETRIITNCMVLTEGWDEPATDCVVVDRGCTSPALWLQMIGRGLRPHAAKKDCLVLDLRGAVYRHGLPEEPRVYSLDGDPIRRDESEAFAIRQCPKCGCANLGGVRECKRCGYVWPPPPIVRAKRVQLRSPEAEARISARRDWYREAVAEARAKGHKPKSVAFRYKAKFGFFPTREVMT